jgi:hypothetical protein
VPAFAIGTAAVVVVVAVVVAVAVAAIVIAGNTAVGCTQSDLHLYIPGRVVVVVVVVAAAAARKWSIVGQRAH